MSDGDLIVLLRDLVKYRALIRALVGRHLHARYRGSFLGLLWSLLNPLCMMLVYTVVFHYYMRFNQVEHYAIFLFCGLLPWLWCASALAEGTTAIASGGTLITKSLFPAAILPVVSVITTLVNFLLSLPLLFLFMWIDAVPIPWTVIFLPGVVAFQFVLLTGIVLALSSLNVFFRDIQHLVANLLGLLFFLCPIVYPLTVAPAKYHILFYLNPFSLLVLLYNDLLLRGAIPSLTHWSILFGWSTFSVVLGMIIYRNYREGFAEAL